jgi:anti-anti-sigma factor
VTQHVDDQGDAGDGVETSAVSIVCHRDGSTGVVELAGDVDLAGGDAVEAAVAELVADGVTDVSVQAQDVTFMDSSGLGGLLAARATVVEANGAFRVGPMADSVARVIDLAGVGDLLIPASA